MPDVNAAFQQAAEAVKTLAQRPSNDTLLSLYALYKQATEGDVAGSRPGMFDVAGRAKYDAWAKLQGTDAASAQQRYIDLVKQLMG